METSNPLATESFSYSWLVDLKPHSSEKSVEKEQNFDFDVSSAPSHFALVDADEIFSEGHILPVYVEKAFKTISPSPVSPLGDHQFASNKEQSRILGRWRRSSRRFWKKCFGFVKPLYQRCSRKSIRVDDLDRKVFEVRSWGNSVENSPWRIDWSHAKKTSNEDEFYFGLNKAKSLNSSPRISPSRSSNAWCGDESSIHEAILYCKRSIEK